MAKKRPTHESIELGSLVTVPFDNGQQAILWIIDLADSLSFLVMDGFFAAAPALPDGAALGMSVAKMPGGNPAGGEDLWKGWFSGRVPKDFRVVGHRALSRKERALARPEGTMIFQNGEHVRSELFKAWRWIHDRPALEAEWALAAAAADERGAERRRNMTLPRMLRERPFGSWSERCSASVLREVRRIFRDATRELISLQDSGNQKKRIAILKGIVTELNALDSGEGFIESVERDEIVERTEALATLVGIDNGDERLTGHRDW